MCGGELVTPEIYACDSCQSRDRALGDYLPRVSISSSSNCICFGCKGKEERFPESIIQYLRGRGVRSGGTVTFMWREGQVMTSPDLLKAMPTIQD